MRITRTSILTGRTIQKELGLTTDDLIKWVEGKRGLIGRIWPTLPLRDREFLISGIPEKEWDNYVCAGAISQFIDEDREELILIPDERQVQDILRLIAVYNPDKPLRDIKYFSF